MTQGQALNILKTGASVFLTGKPGSGKTHTVNRYVAWLKAHGINPALTASTGIAATHIGGMTVHSWSGIGIADVLTPFDLDRIGSIERIFKRIDKASVLILDEVSMLSAAILEMVDAVCREVKRNDEPFGGLQVVLVGDFFQLPPVTRKGRTVNYAFNSTAWKRLQPTVCYLDEQYRQDDAIFLSLLSAIRANGVDETHFQVLKSRISTRSEAPKNIVKLYSHNADVDRINDAELASLPEKPKVYEMRSRGKKHVVESLIRSCLSPEKLTLKIGAAVMFTRNDPQGRFANGTTGKVERFDADSGLPEVRLQNGKLVEVETIEWKVDDQGRELACITQIPLRLAWAMTIHKSQGMSLDAALMDLGATFEYGQGYVALSRVRSLEGLFLLGCNQRALQVHPEILEQDGKFRDASLEAETTSASEEDADIQQKIKRFVEACGGSLDRPAEKPKTMETIREKYPKAYVRWTEQEEKALKAAFQKGTPIKEIAKQLGRQRGGITSRLKKLGLIENSY